MITFSLRSLLRRVNDPPPLRTAACRTAALTFSNWHVFFYHVLALCCVRLRSGTQGRACLTSSSPFRRRSYGRRPIELPYVALDPNGQMHPSPSDRVGKYTVQVYTTYDDDSHVVRPRLQVLFARVYRARTV